MSELLIYGPIGESVETVKKIRAAAGSLTVRINSPGGNVFDAMAIYNALAERTTPATIIVDGLAASAASIISMAGRPIRMAQESQMMIHAVSSEFKGNAAAMRRIADVLERLDQSLIGIYARRTGKPANTIAGWLATDTWFNAAEARDAGLCDEVAGEFKNVARFDLSHFENVPAAVMNRYATK
jgi:ATP-dependent protease ClpP protease subunit